MKTGRLRESLLGPQSWAPGWSHQSFCPPGQRGKRILLVIGWARENTTKQQRTKETNVWEVPQESDGSPFNMKLPVNFWCLSGFSSC